MNGLTDRRTDRQIGANLNAPLTMVKGYKKQFLMSLKNWWNMAYTVCHAPINVINNIIIAAMSHCQSDVTAEPHSAKGLCKTFANFVVAMVIDLWCHRCTSMADRIKSFKAFFSTET